jgi:hypothetical protein
VVEEPPLGALAIARSIWPRFHGWVDPGRGLIEQRAPELLSGAEATISALIQISRNNPHGDIEDPVAGWENDLHETHPPLRDRIALARSLNVEPALPPDGRPARVLLETLIASSRPAEREVTAG